MCGCNRTSPFGGGGSPAADCFFFTSRAFLGVDFTWHALLGTNTER